MARYQLESRCHLAGSILTDTREMVHKHFNISTTSNTAAMQHLLRFFKCTLDLQSILPLLASHPSLSRAEGSTLVSLEVDNLNPTNTVLHRRQWSGILVTCTSISLGTICYCIWVVGNGHGIEPDRVYYSNE